MRSHHVNHAVVSVGSNIDPIRNLLHCKIILDAEVQLIGEAPWIETAPVGFRDQANFINGAFYIKTSMELTLFNAYLKSVEARLGRVKSKLKSGPRTMDLDIILWNTKVVHGDFYAQDYVKIPVVHLLEKYNIRVSDGIGE